MMTADSTYDDADTLSLSLLFSHDDGESNERENMRDRRWRLGGLVMLAYNRTKKSLHLNKLSF